MSSKAAIGTMAQVLEHEETVARAIYKTLRLSTAHITEDDAARLGGIADGCPNVDLVVDSRDGGWRVFIGLQICVNHDLITEIQHTAADAGMSLSFAKCVRAAVKHDCTWIEFDCDDAKLTKELRLDEHDW